MRPRLRARAPWSWRGGGAARGVVIIGVVGVHEAAVGRQQQTRPRQLELPPPAPRTHQRLAALVPPRAVRCGQCQDDVTDVRACTHGRHRFRSRPSRGRAGCGRDAMRAGARAGCNPNGTPAGANESYARERGGAGKCEGSGLTPPGGEGVANVGPRPGAEFAVPVGVERLALLVVFLLRVQVWAVAHQPIVSLSRLPHLCPYRIASAVIYAASLQHTTVARAFES